MKRKILAAVAAFVAACAVMIGAGSAAASSTPWFTDGSATASPSGLEASWKQRGHEPGALVTNYVATKVYALWLSPYIYVRYPDGSGTWRHSYANLSVPELEFATVRATADSDGVAHFSHHVDVPAMPTPVGEHGRDQLALAKLTYRIGVTDQPSTVWSHYFRDGPFAPASPVVWQDPDATHTPPTTAP
jgi:hypothetical protein